MSEQNKPDAVPSVHDLVRRPLIGREWVDEQDRKWTVTDMVRPGVYRIEWRRLNGLRSGEVQAAFVRKMTEPLVECSWCGTPLNGKKMYGNRIHSEELFCSRSHRDASTAAVKRLMEHVIQWP